MPQRQHVLRWFDPNDFGFSQVLYQPEIQAGPAGQEAGVALVRFHFDRTMIYPISEEYPCAIPKNFPDGKSRGGVNRNQKLCGIVAESRIRHITAGTSLTR